MLLLHEISDLLNEHRFIHLIRNFCYDNLLSFLLEILNEHLCLHEDMPFALRICVDDAISTLNNASCREIGPCNELHQIMDSDSGIVNKRS